MLRSSINMQVLLALLFLAVVTGVRSVTKNDPAYNPTTLEQRRTTSWEVTYQDANTGSNTDFQVWRPRLRSGEYRITYTAVISYAAISHPTVVVKGGTQSALVPPLYFVCEWTDAGTGGDHDGSFWRPVAPSGYTCLSDVAVFMSNSGIRPGVQRNPEQIDSAFRCVKNSLVKATDLGDQAWKDAGSEGDYDGAVWHIHHSDGMRVSRGGVGWVRPPDEDSTLKEFTGGLYRGMDRVFSVTNPNSQAQPSSSFAMTQGLSVSSSSSSSISAEMGHELSVGASAGVEGVASSSMSYTIRQQFGLTTSFSSTETSTEQTQVTVNFNVPAKTRVDLWQLIVTDSEDGDGSFKIRSSRYVIQEDRLS